MFVFSFAMRAPARADKGLEEKRDEVVGIVISLQDDVPPVSPVAAIRSPVGDEFFPAEAAAPVSPVPSLGVNANLVNESHDWARVLEIGPRVE
jgi:hypothetical protein